jgi:hypothetical protein
LPLLLFTRPSFRPSLSVTSSLRGIARCALAARPGSQLIQSPAKFVLAAAALTSATVLATAAASGSAAASTAAAVTRAHAARAVHATSLPGTRKPVTHQVAEAPSTQASQADRTHAVRRAGRNEHRPGHWARKAHAVIPAEPYRIYDSITPSAIPSNNVVATYATGGYAVSAAAVRHEKKLLWIDTRGTDPGASVLDVEPGDATPGQAAGWAWHRLHDRPRALARIYTMLSEWAAVKTVIAQLPERIRARVRWWIADPTGTPHIVPGSDATQWYWGHSYDITTATPRF